MQQRTVEFLFDVGSPYSYLAATQLEALALRTGAAFRWRPFLLGGVFKATGNHTPATVAAKARWMLEDLHRWAERYGVAFAFSKNFPRNTLRAQRALTAAARQGGDQVVPALALALFEAYWVHDHDVTDDAVIGQAVAAASELEPATVLAALDQQQTKDALRATTDEAVARGAFGAPTFLVDDTMYWGNDRMVLLEDYLRG